MDETTASLALLEDRQELEEQLGSLLDDLPPDLGLLVVRRGPNAGSTFALEAETTTIGRHPDSDLFLDDVTVSRRHATHHPGQAGYQISDVGSLNGTYVHGERDRHRAPHRRVRDPGRPVRAQLPARRPGRGRLVSASFRDEAHLSIGEVLTHLQDEFPDITVSKIRFLESQGLIDPERTPSGYRQFYGPDLERLRWILHQQREHFLPLKVIKERLDQYGAGRRAAPRGRRRGPARRPRRRALTPGRVVALDRASTLPLEPGRRAARRRRGPRPAHRRRGRPDARRARPTRPVATWRPDDVADPDRVS